MIALREVVTDEDLEAWRQVRLAVLPDERTPSLQELRSWTMPGDVHLLAYAGGALVGSGFLNRSDSGGAHIAPRVMPDWRGRGVGTVLLRRLAELAVNRGFANAVAGVDGNDTRSIGFAARFGFVEQSREIQQVLEVTGSPERADIPGVTFVSIDERPDLLEQAYPLARQGYEDMPIDGIDVSLQRWLAEGATLAKGSFVALANGEIVGFAGLLAWPGEPKAEHGLTVVRRDWRRKGLATALKRQQIDWAAHNEIRELVTYTQTGNEGMQRVNAQLGYVTCGQSISFARALPL